MAENIGTKRRHNGAAIRAFWIKDGHKTGTFATLAKLSYPALDNIENERKEASPEALYRIAAALNVPVAAILRDPVAFAALSAEPGVRKLAV